VETDRQQHQVRGQLPLAARYHGDLTATVDLRHAALGDPRRPDPAGPVIDELLYGHRELAVAALLVRRVVAQDPGPRRPGIAGRVPLLRRQRVQVELGDARGTLPVRDTQAVRRGVTAPDDDHVLARSVDRCR